MPPAARITDSVEHGFGLAGMMGGAVLGALAGAALVTAGVATGGLAIAALVIGATSVGGLAGGEIAQGIGTLLNMGFTTGAIIAQGSPNVIIGGQRAARAGLDGASCDGAHSFHHIGMPPPTALIAQGSSTVQINGMPAARMSDKLICGGDIKTGQGNVLIGGVAKQMLPIDDVERQFKDFLIGMGLLSAVLGLGAAFVGVSSFAGFLSALGGIAKGVGAGAAFLLASGAAEKYLPPGWNQIAAGVIDIVGFATMAKVFEGCGDPIYPPTGEVVSKSTDFVLPGALELRFERYYASGLKQSDWLGPNWTCTWGQRVVNTGAGVVYYYPADGRRIIFELDEPADLQGWLRNPEAPKLRLRPTFTGFEVQTEGERLQRFDRASYFPAQNS
jgi:uncharacterized Zn-binding protein involved in type VI secretion